MIDMSLTKCIFSIFKKSLFPLFEERNSLIPGLIKKANLNQNLVAQMVMRLPTMRETLVKSLGWEDLLEKEIAAHPSILAWKIPWMEEPGRLQSMGWQRVRHD